MGYNSVIDYHTVQEVAELLRLSTLTIYKYIKEGNLEAIEFGGHYRVSSSSLKDFIQGHKVEGTNK